MNRLRHLRDDESGMALLLAIAITIMLTVASVALFTAVSGETERSMRATERDAAYHAAEAGIDDYAAKLLADHVYFGHEVHPGEATRRAPSGITAGAGSTWSAGGAWTYPNGKDAWRALPNGYEYDLQVAAPTASSQGVRIVATGRKAGETESANWRTIETYVRQASVTDFQMLANADISYGSTATTYGKIYAGIDGSGVAHSVNHSGTAYADVYAERNVTGPPALRNGARTYDRNTIRSVIKSPINFNDFLTSLVDIQRASQAGGVYLNSASVDAWRLTFSGGGTFTAQACTRSSGRPVEQTSPTCGVATTYSMPANGAVYAAQTAIVSGTVDGRVTVASNVNVVVGGTIAYAVSGDDVLGLVAARDVIVAQWTPSVLTWRAATIAQSGSWKSYSNDGSHSSMTFTGSTSTNLGGSMSMFRTRVYLYDETLMYLQPPWFPTIDGGYTVLLRRELPGGAS